MAKDSEAASVATTLAAPTGLDARELVQRARSGRELALSAGIGELARAVVRIDHTGRRARLDVVLEALEALGGVLFETVDRRGRVQDALDAAEAAYRAAGAQV